MLSFHKYFLDLNQIENTSWDKATFSDHISKDINEVWRQQSLLNRSFNVSFLGINNRAIYSKLHIGTYNLNEYTLE